MDKTHGESPDPLLEDRYIVPGLVRGLRALGVFSPERKELTLADLARELGLSRSAAFRTAYTLTQMGFLLQDPRSKTYSLGPAVLRLGYGYMATRELVEIALPEIERLRDETDWSTHLGVRDGDRVLYMLRCPSRMGMGSIVHVGSRLPAANTTMGRVLLADVDEATLIALYRDQTGPGRSFAEIRAHWARDRAAETVEQIGSFEAGIASVAAPVRDMSGRVIAAINATRATEDSGPISPELRAAVRKTGQRISALLGGV
ncbi:IclR family transcriptional regulator [Pseudodonghicola flavimaris]|uniref:IclR family transcriptional regulator n=1 Tax=Pseudodonghicola flavimaris TaxID=3050036 RepID=A0ABT7F6G4_9RHOB|nr:IclR family transcriptional regulator [Pseudodonghicola flavimaris]MDK3020188.1 IclR family transcriptional regulator [Pseudodonghicola flavimaris]